MVVTKKFPVYFLQEIEKNKFIPRNFQSFNYLLNKNECLIKQKINQIKKPK